MCGSHNLNQNWAKTTSHSRVMLIYESAEQEIKALREQNQTMRNLLVDCASRGHTVTYTEVEGEAVPQHAEDCPGCMAQNYLEQSR